MKERHMEITLTKEERKWVSNFIGYGHFTILRKPIIEFETKRLSSMFKEFESLEDFMTALEATVGEVVPLNRWGSKTDYLCISVGLMETDKEFLSLVGLHRDEQIEVLELFKNQADGGLLIEKINAYIHTLENDLPW